MRRNATVINALGLTLATGLVLGLLPGTAHPQALPGGTLDPLTIPKYVTPLVIPPVMKDAAGDNSTSDYDIAVRQFQQQILPGGIWSTLNPAIGTTLPSFPATTVWSYGPAADSANIIAPDPTSQFNYPAYTIENLKDLPTTVDWINDLVDADGNHLPHLLPIDQTLHWANPGADCISGAIRTDCRGQSQALYTGPVPIVTHVHGAHVGPESDGYPEAWWLPDAADIVCGTAAEAAADPTDNIYVCEGTLANGYYPGQSNTNVTRGVANYSYPNDQPSTTLWYHDHSLGMTRNNVYAGPAGFWLIRDSAGVNGETGLVSGVLPAPAPAPQEDLVTTNFPSALGGAREKYREIPIVIQDRSFNADGSLFYPANRAFFEGLGDGQTPTVPGNTGAGLDIDFIPTNQSDISPIWNPEAFFNVMVVNGVSWPEFEVAPAIYRLRLLNGCNSRFLNLSLQQINGQGQVLREIPFYQIGAEQSVLPQVVRIETGFATSLPGNGSDVNPKWPTCTRPNGKPRPNCVPQAAAPFAEQALLMGLAERADVLVDFSGLKTGDIVRMINTGPDAPYGGFPLTPADPATTGQVMQFRVNATLASAGGPLGAGATDPVDALGNPNPNAATAPALVALSLADPTDPAVNPPACPGAGCRDLALLEEESAVVCVNVDMAGNITQVAGTPPDCGGLGVPFAPKAAVLGYEGAMGGTTTLWSDPIVTNPDSGATETWELWNWSADAHPIHLHLVKFKVVNREPFDVGTGNLQGAVLPEADEAGWKDTVIAYPGEVTRVAATFDKDGLYVWHCHIVEHEDNEMMVPYCVGDPNANGCAGL